MTALLAPRFLAESETHPGELDLPGAVTGTLGLLGLVYGFSRAGSEGWSDPWTVSSLVAGALVLALLLFIESRVEHPLLPSRVFLNRTCAASFGAMFLAPAAMFAMFFYLSQYIQVEMATPRSRRASRSCRSASAWWSRPASPPTLINRIDPRFIAGTGTLLAASGLFAGFSRLPYDTTAPAAPRPGAWTRRTCCRSSC